MTKLTITLLFGWMLLLFSNLNAQNREGLFNLKEGDWFEANVNIGIKEMDDSQYSFCLRYILEKQLKNSNQQYSISVEHITAKAKATYGIDLGFDSYYPTFDENKTYPEKKNKFTLEVTPSGKIIGFASSINNKKVLKIDLFEIGSKVSAHLNRSISLSYFDSLIVRMASNFLMNPSLNSTREFDSNTGTIGAKLKNNSGPILEKSSRISANGLPLSFKSQDIQFTLTNSSYNISGNSIIQGKIVDQINQEVIVSLLGENAAYNLPEKRFQTNTKGSFSCPIFLKRPLHLKVQIGDKTLTTFMEPGDSLFISTLGYQAKELPFNHYLNTKPGEYFSLGLKKSDYFTGTAAYNTMLSNEMDQYRNYFSYNNGIKSVIDYCFTTSKAVNKLIDSYRGKASEACIDYFQRDWNFFIAADKFEFYSSNSIFKNGFIQNTIDRGYQTDFFAEADTLSILMNPYEWNTSYQKFITRAQVYKQQRIGQAVGKTNSDNFLENFYFSQASLRGFPLYNQLAKSIDRELRNGLKENNVIERYYQDFINNCSDPALNEPLIKIHETAVHLKIGNQFPINSFVLQDNSVFILNKFKGKSLCIVLLDRPDIPIKPLIEEIAKFKSDEVEFLIAWLPSKNYTKLKIDSAFLSKPNITFVELAEQNIKSKLLLNESKIFMLDKWSRIVENNAEDPMRHKYKGSVSKFEKSLRKTIDAKHYSKAEKIAVVKTAGWSFGSVLFTFLVGLWIYRIRVRRIRAQEAVKRRIKELEIKAIRSQMNPHFIFNALNSIQSLINGNQFKEANIYLSKFAVLLRGVLNNSEKSRISLSDELLAVELYCQLEQLRFEFKFEISIDPQVNCDLIEIPGMIIQPLAENAILHGLSTKGDLGQLNIRVERQNGNLCIGVMDNGAGLSPKLSDSLSQKGFGLKLVEERINILNLDGNEARLTVTNNRNNIGTIATLTLPID